METYLFVSVKKNEFVGTFEGFESDPVTIPHIRYLTQPVKVNRQLTNDPFVQPESSAVFAFSSLKFLNFPILTLHSMETFSAAISHSPA